MASLRPATVRSESVLYVFTITPKSNIIIIPKKTPEEILQGAKMLAEQKIKDGWIKKDAVAAWKEIQEATYQKLYLLVEDSSHPSLRLEKLSEEIWAFSVTMNYRVTFP